MAEAMLLKGGRRARACGNVGNPVIDLATDSETEILVLELSSFQLAWSHEARILSSGILNIADDHIDWHGSFENYAAAKLSIADLSETLVANLDDEELSKRIGKTAARLITYTLNTPKPHQIGLVENLIVDRAFVSGDAEVLFELNQVKPAVPHNVSNAMAAAALARSVGVDATAIAEAIEEFRLDHHRLEIVLEKDGVTWIDDSKATNPHAALASLRSQLKSIWIAGGLAKGASMDQLVKAGASRIKFVILIGTDAKLIEDAIRTHAPLVEYQVIDKAIMGRELMDEVVRLALAKASSGDSVLLAPACASMDQFKNYGERGDFFADAVRKIVDGK
jgi:UDP-N-acetylmuramoylalanine--D-glutamate ligase